MNKLYSFTLTVLVAILCFPLTLNSAANINVASSSLQLNGIAIQSELRSDWFINALYLVNKTNDPNAILSDINPKRMEIKVLADKLSGRRLKRFWVERIRINNEPEDVLGMAKAVRGFANMMGQNLEANDVISIDFIPGEATRVSINGSVQGDFSPDLYNLIVKSWVGERPPSQEFKDAILGNTNFDTLLSRYQSIQPSEARVAYFDKKLQQQIAAQKQAEEEQKLAEELKIAEAKALAEQQRLSVLAEQQRLEDERQARLAKEAEAKQLEEQRKLELARQAEEAAQKPPIVEVPEGPTAEEIAKIKSGYVRTLQRHYSPHFEYPVREIIKRHGASIFNRPKKGKTHGLVKVNVELDRDGDIVSGGLAGSSGEKILDDAVLKALFDAVPYPAMPNELEDETFSTTLSISIPAPKS
ncbi:TonB family protein [Kangiella sp. TOML190]|uniref:TonB family protein n=1 Tax=Kangiella sp. TOML190 TaxID=2931351 RepID=UPI0020408D67|nr:TonB family protein [Kangiella sp. TOML190]